MSAQTTAIDLRRTLRGPGKRMSVWGWMSIGALVLLAIFLVLPVVNIVGRAFLSGGGLDAWRTFFTEGPYLTAVGNTLILATVVTFLASAVGVMLAYLTVRYSFWLQAIVALLPLSTLIVPELIVTQSWLSLIGNNGIVRKGFAAIGIQLPPFYGWMGLILVMTLIYYTYVYIGTVAALKGFDSTLEEAARSLGSSTISARLKVMIPVISPAVAASALLVFTMVVGNFATSALVGGRVRLLSPLTYQAFLSETGGDPAMQSVLASISIIIVMVILLWQRRSFGRKDYQVTQGRGQAPIPLRGRSLLFVGIPGAVIVAASGLPLLTVMVLAFTKSNGPVTQWGTFTLDNFEKVFVRNPGPILNTIQFGLIATVIGVTAAVLLSVLIVKKKNILTPLIDYAAMVPLAMSGTVLGVGLSMTFNSGPLPLTGTSAIIILAYVVRRLPLSLRNTSSTLYNIPDSLEDASMSLGVPPFRSFLKVLLPLMMPAISTAIILTWTTTIAELSGSLLVYSAGKETVTIQMFRLLNTGLNTEAAAYGLALIALAVVPVLVAVKVFNVKIF
jgi:iron(III) transport system permease protein